MYSFLLFANPGTRPWPWGRGRLAGQWLGAVGSMGRALGRARKGPDSSGPAGCYAPDYDGGCPVTYDLNKKATQLK